MLSLCKFDYFLLMLSSRSIQDYSLILLAQFISLTYVRELVTALVSFCFAIFKDVFLISGKNVVPKPKSKMETFKTGIHVTIILIMSL